MPAGKSDDEQFAAARQTSESIFLSETDGIEQHIGAASVCQMAHCIFEA